MSEINSILANFEAAKASSETISFSKKNAWKNEWEKAQLESRNNASTNSPSDNSSRNPERELVENRGFPVSSPGVYSAVPEKTSGTTANIGLTTGSNAFIASNKKNTAIFPFTTSATVDIQNISNISDARLSPDNIKVSTLKINYIQNVLEQAEIRFGSVFKPQNLNLLITGNGVKMLLRDYRLDKNQLDAIVENITDHLKELGINITELIVNGNKSNYFNNNTDNNDAAINITGETS